jgi:MFS family permease
MSGPGQGAADMVILPGGAPRGARRDSRPGGVDVSDRQTDPQLPVPQRSRGFRSVLRNRFFLRLWTAQLISQTIMNAANYGLIVLVASQQGSVTATAGAIIAFALPAALFSAPAGVIVDRLDRRTVLWVSNVLRALASLGFVASLLISPKAVLPVYLLSFFTATVGQFFAPAEGAAIPQLVHKDELVNALALFNITFTMAQVLGLILLGPAIVIFAPTLHLGTVHFGTVHHSLDVGPVELLFVILAGLYLICALLILSIPARLMRKPRAPRGARKLSAEDSQARIIVVGVAEALRFIRRDRQLLIAVLQQCIGGTVIAFIATIAPNFVSEFFHRPKEQAALVFIPAGVGLVIGSVLTPEVMRRLRSRTTIAAGVIILAICAVLLTLARAVTMAIAAHEKVAWWSLWPYLGVAILLTFFVGIALDLINIPAQTVMQERSPDWIKGRVLSVQGMVLNGVTVPFVFLMGIAADTLGLAAALEIVAVVVVLAGLSSVYASVGRRPGAPHKEGGSDG